MAKINLSWEEKINPHTQKNQHQATHNFKIGKKVCGASFQIYDIADDGDGFTKRLSTTVVSPGKESKQEAYDFVSVKDAKDHASDDSYVIALGRKCR